MSTRSASSSTSLDVRRPGWLARRPARGGIAHRRGRVGVGYRSAFAAVDLTERELAHHGALFGGPGSCKKGSAVLNPAFPRNTRCRRRILRVSFGHCSSSLSTDYKHTLTPLPVTRAAAP